MSLFISQSILPTGFAEFSSLPCCLYRYLYNDGGSECVQRLASACDTEFDISVMLT